MKWLQLGIAVVAVAVIGWTYRAGYTAGRDANQAAMARAVEIYQQEANRAWHELEEARGRIRAEYRDRIRIMRQAVDPTGCLDQRLPDDILRVLRPADRGDAAAGGTDTGLPDTGARGRDLPGRDRPGRAQGAGAAGVQR